MRRITFGEIKLYYQFARSVCNNKEAIRESAADPPYHRQRAQKKDKAKDSVRFHRECALRQIRQQGNLLLIEWWRGQRMASDNRLTLEFSRTAYVERTAAWCSMRARAPHIDKVKMFKIINQIREHMFAITFFASFNRFLSFVFCHFCRRTVRQCSVY